MIRSWRDRVLRFGLGACFGYLVCCIIVHRTEQELVANLACAAGLAFILGMLTADVERKRS